MTSRHLAPLVVTVSLVVGLLVAACASAVPSTPTRAAAPPTAVSGVQPSPAPTVAAAPATAAPTVAPTNPAAVQAKDGGTLTILMPEDTSTGIYDAHYGGTTGFTAFFDNVYETLLTRDRDTLEMKGALAERWEIAPDATSVTLYLRKGVKWHNITPVNGREFTSADVKWNIERIRDSQPPTPVAGFVAVVKSVETPDKYTVKLNLKESNAPLMFWLASPGLMMYPRELQEAYGDKQVKVAVGTGPYMLKSYEPKQQFTLVKNPDYWDKGLPHTDTLKLVIISDAAARLAAIRTGQGDVLFGIAPSDMAGVKRTNSDIQTFEHLGSAFIIRLNPTRKPLDDIRVRKAIHLAMDRQAVIQLAAGGKGGVLGWLLPNAVPFAEKEADLIKQPGFRQPKDQDVAEAKKLLAEAGYPNGVTIEALTNSATAYITAHEVMKEQLKAAGITLNIKVQDYNILLKALVETGDFSFMYVTSGFTGDPDTLWNSFHSTAYLNKVGMGTSETDKLLLQQRQEMNDAKRLSVYKQLEAKLYETLWMIPMYYSTQYMLVRPGVKDMRPLPNTPQINFGAAYRYAWIDK